MDSIDFAAIFEKLPEVLKNLDTSEKIIGLLVLFFPLIVVLMIRGLQQPQRGLVVLAAFCGVLLFLYFKLETRVEQLVAEQPPQTAPGTTPAAFAASLPAGTGTARIPARPSVRPAVSDGFIFPQSGRTKLKPGQIAPLSDEQLWLARNEIFARKGRYFRSPELKTYFEQFDWYQPDSWEPALNSIEIENLNRIKAEEARR